VTAPVGPTPFLHPCTECAQGYDSSEALHEHVAADHRPAPDGLELVEALLALRGATSEPPAPGGPSARRGPRRARGVVRACTGPALLAWVLWSAGVSLEVIVVGGLGVAAVVTAAALHLWAEAEVRRHDGRPPSTL